MAIIRDASGFSNTVSVSVQKPVSVKPPQIRTTQRATLTGQSVTVEWVGMEKAIVLEAASDPQFTRIAYSKSMTQADHTIMLPRGTYWFRARWQSPNIGR